jgi:hypothetical protein
LWLVSICDPIHCGLRDGWGAREFLAGGVLIEKTHEHRPLSANAPRLPAGLV